MKESKFLVEQFGISEPTKSHFVLNVKGIKFTTSIKELEFLRDLTTSFLEEKQEPLKYIQIFE